MPEHLLREALVGGGHALRAEAGVTQHARVPKCSDARRQRRRRHSHWRPRAARGEGWRADLRIRRWGRPPLRRRRVASLTGANDDPFALHPRRPRLACRLRRLARRPHDLWPAPQEATPPQERRSGRAPGETTPGIPTPGVEPVYTKPVVEAVVHPATAILFWR